MREQEFETLHARAIKFEVMRIYSYNIANKS